MGRIDLSIGFEELAQIAFKLHENERYWELLI
jgi:hypothetical protein